MNCSYKTIDMSITECFPDIKRQMACWSGTLPTNDGLRQTEEENPAGRNVYGHWLSTNGIVRLEPYS